MKLIKELKDRNHYKVVEVVMKVPNERYKLRYNDLDNDKYNEMLNIINNLLSNVNKNTK